MALIDLFGPITKIVEKLIPDKQAQAQAKLDLLELQQRGELQEIQIQMSAILAEAQSPDKWTSRARPSFLYVVYVLMLSAIPMGIVYAVSPNTATNITAGFKAWLGALPPDIVDLFQWVMLGYIGGRSFEKIKGAAK